MFENIERILREGGSLCIEEERYGSGFLIGIDMSHSVNNATETADATTVYRSGDIADAIDTATSPGDMDAVAAMDKLTGFVNLHPEFLFAMGNSLDDCLFKMEKRASLWNSLLPEQQNALLLGFVDYVPY